jgi:hypothetical protein
MSTRGAVVALLFVLSGCSGNEEGTPPRSPRTPIELAPDTTGFEATWKAETVIVEADTIAATLLNPFAEDGVYRFAPGATTVAALTAGQIVVLTGVDLVRVLSVEATDDAIVLTTEPASLTDAVSDAVVSWDVGVDASKPIQLNDGSGTLRPLAAPQIVCRPPAVTTECKSSFSGTLGNLKTTQELETEPEGTLKMKLSMEYPLQGNSVLKVALVSHVRSFRHEGSFIIHGGNLESAYVSLRDIELDVDIDAGAVAIGGGENFFKLPLKLTFPFELGPIPAYLTVSGAITITPELSEQSSLRAHAKFHVSGSAGFTIEGTTLTSSGALANVDGMEPTVSDVSYISTVTAGFGTVYEFPRIGLGIGIAEKASIEGYVTPKVEVVMNQVLKTDGLGIITSSCTKVDGNFGVFAGGSFRLGGIELGKEVQLFGATHEIYEDGRAHGQADPAACD